MNDTDFSEADGTRLVELEGSPDRWTQPVDTEIQGLRARQNPAEADEHSQPIEGEAEQPDGQVSEPGALPAEAVESFFESFNRVDPDMAADLRAEWGAMADVRLGQVQAWANAHPKAAEEAERTGLAFDADALKVAALMGAGLKTSGPAPSASPGPVATGRAALEAEERAILDLPHDGRWDKRNDDRLTEIRAQLNPGTFNRFGGGIEGRS